MDKELTRTHWDGESKKWQKIIEAGGLTAVVNALENRDKFTMGLVPVLACMDEGAAQASDGSYPAFRCAGAGILTGPTLEDAVQETIKLVSEHQIEAIADHKNCGAGSAKAKQLGLESEKGDLLAIEHAEDVAAKAGIGHISVPLGRPTGLHIATCTYVAGVPFNPAPVVDAEGRQILPAGFVVTRLLGKELTLSDVEMSIEIALGSHGYGREMFSRNNPFRLVPVSTSETRAAKLAEELAPICEKYNGFVVIEPLVLSL